MEGCSGFTEVFPRGTVGLRMGRRDANPLEPPEVPLRRLIPGANGNGDHATATASMADTSTATARNCGIAFSCLFSLACRTAPGGLPEPEEQELGYRGN